MYFRRASVIIAVALLLPLAATADRTETLNQPLECMKDYNFKRFMVAAWCFHNYLGTDYGPAYAKAVEAAGFNVALETGLMVPHYEKTSVKVMVSTMITDTLVERDVWGIKRNHPAEKRMSVADAFKKYGKSPAVMGFHVGSKYGHRMPSNLAAAVKETNALKAGLVPWIAHCTDLNAHAAAGSPIVSIETFKRTKWAGFGCANKGWKHDKRKDYCNYMEWGRRTANARNMAFVPMIPCMRESKGYRKEKVGYRHGDSEIRFQVLSAIAYGAQGVMYFAYSSNRECWHAQPSDGAYAGKTPGKPGPNFKVTRDVNTMVTQVIGPRVLGCRSIGVYQSHPTDSKHPKAHKARHSLNAGEGKLIEKLDHTAMAGVLVHEADFKSGKNTPAYVMLVDMRTDVREAEERSETLKPRELKLTFGPMVKAVEVIGAPGEKNRVFDREVKVSLRGGDGRLLKLTMATETE